MVETVNSQNLSLPNYHYQVFLRVITAIGCQVPVLVQCEFSRFSLFSYKKKRIRNDFVSRIRIRNNSYGSATLPATLLRLFICLLFQYRRTAPPHRYFMKLTHFAVPVWCLRRQGRLSAWCRPTGWTLATAGRAPPPAQTPTTATAPWHPTGIR